MNRAMPEDSTTLVLSGIRGLFVARDKQYLRNANPMHERKKKEHSATPRRVEASGDVAAAEYDTAIHQAAETYATAAPMSRPS
jgi:hypothetical protein